MGAGQSISESMVSTQTIVNDINNISQENCINSCTNDIEDVKAVFIDTTMSGFNIETRCNIVGASCILKASLTNDLHNKQKTIQSGKSLQESDPFSLMGNLFGGENIGINEASNEATINRITNIMNSTCEQNTATEISDIDIEFIGDNVTGDINILASSSITKSSCMLDNMARNIVANDQATDQSEKAMQGSPILYAIIGVVLCVVVVAIAVLLLGLTLGGGGIAAKVISHRHRKAVPPAPPPPVLYTGNR